MLLGLVLIAIHFDEINYFIQVAAPHVTSTLAIVASFFDARESWLPPLVLAVAGGLAWFFFTSKWQRAFNESVYEDMKIVAGYLHDLYPILASIREKLYENIEEVSVRSCDAGSPLLSKNFSSAISINGAFDQWAVQNPAEDIDRLKKRYISFLRSNSNVSPLEVLGYIRMPYYSPLVDFLRIRKIEHSQKIDMLSEALDSEEHEDKRDERMPHEESFPFLWLEMDLSCDSKTSPEFNNFIKSRENHEKLLALYEDAYERPREYLSKKGEAEEELQEKIKQSEHRVNRARNRVVATWLLRFAEINEFCTKLRKKMRVKDKDFAESTSQKISK